MMRNRCPKGYGDVYWSELCIAPNGGGIEHPRCPISGATLCIMCNLIPRWEDKSEVNKFWSKGRTDAQSR